MAEYKVIGKPLPRPDAAGKVTGTTTYVGDIKLPGMLHAKVLRSPHPHARVIRIETGKARALPGVVGVFTADDLPFLPKDTSMRAYNVLARDEVIFVGQPVAAVVADDPYTAEEAVSLINVVYEELPAIIDPLEALKEDAPPVALHLGEEAASEEATHTTLDPVKADRPTRSKNVSQHMVFRRGDVAKAFAESEVIVENTFHASMVHQGYIEPQGAIADYAADGQLTIWVSTQGHFVVRSEVSKIVGIPETRILAVPVEMGGGFGGKAGALSAALAAALAIKVRRPVRAIWTRHDDLSGGNPPPQAIIDLKIGAKRDGSLTALQSRVVFDACAYPGTPMVIAMIFLGSYYRWPNLLIEGFEVMTNKVSTGALRAPGVPQGTFAIESLFDDLARKLGADPLEFRLRHAVQTGDLMANDRRYPSIGLKECIQRMAETPLWKSRGKVPGRGYGLAIGGWLGGSQPSGATVALNSDGTVRVTVGATDITGVNTSFLQIAAEELGVDPSLVHVTTGDTNSAPFAGVSGGSKTLRSVGLAVRAAAIDAREQIVNVAASMLEANPADIECVDGQVRVKGSPEKAVHFRDVASVSSGFGARYSLVLGRGGTGSPKQAPGFSAQAAAVEVDPQTGKVSLVDFVTVQDVGFAINPLSVEGQMQGGASQGIGTALSEELLFDEKGAVRNPNLLDYRLPTMADIPPIAAEIVEVPIEEAPYGTRGVGEPPITPTSAAIANAVADAIGVRVTRIPITPERVLRALGRLREDA